MKLTLICGLILASMATGVTTPTVADNDEVQKDVVTQSLYGVIFLDDEVADDDGPEEVHVHSRRH